MIVKTFKTISRIKINFEVRKRVHRKLTIFNQNNMKLLYTIMYEQREKLAHSYKFLVNNHVLILEWNHASSWT